MSNKKYYKIKFKSKASSITLSHLSQKKSQSKKIFACDWIKLLRCLSYIVIIIRISIDYSII